MPTLRVNGVRLHYELSGAGEPMVLVHGSWTDGRTWAHVAPALARSFRLLTYDRRGHSRSARPAGQGSVREDVADLAALVEALGLAPAHVVGGSFGGSIALRLLVDHRELIRTVQAHEPPLLDLLDDDPAGATALAEAWGRIDAVAALLDSGDAEGGARLFIEAIALGPGGWDERLSPEGRAMLVANAPTWLDEVRDPEAFALPLERIREPDRPVLITVGEESSPSLARAAERLVAGVRGAEGRVLAGAGHVPHLSHPEGYARMVSRFAVSASAPARDGGASAATW